MKPYATAYGSVQRTVPPAPSFRATDVHALAMHLVLDITAFTGAPAVTLSVWGVDHVANKRWLVGKAQPQNALGTTRLTVSPMLPPSSAPNLTVVQDHVPHTFEIDVEHGNADPITYSVGAQFIQPNEHKY